MGVTRSFMLQTILSIVALVVVTLAVLRFRLGQRENVRAEPFMDALLSASELEQHARDLATRHRLKSRTPAGGKRLPRPAEAQKVFMAVQRELSRAAGEGYTVAPAGEWFLDNFYVIQAGVRDIANSMPPGYYRELPKLASGRLKGYPRVYGLAVDLISHTDGRIDVEAVERFFGAYQSVIPLSIGEVWAIPTFLRVGLIENLKYLSLQVVNAQRQRQRAGIWLDSLLSDMRKQPDDLDKLLGERVRSLQHMDSTFATELLYRLRNEGSVAAPIAAWLDERLAALSTTADDIVHLEHQRQSAREISVRNAINSLRTLSATNWTETFEKLSLVEKILRDDPDGTYPAMDFASRDLYRHEVESIAKQLGTSEVQVARQAVDCARVAAGHNGSPAERHVGYYLLDQGRLRLLEKLGHSQSRWEELLSNVGEHRLAPYLLSILAGTVFILTGLLAYGQARGLRGGMWLWLLIIGLVPAADLAVRLVHTIVTRLVRPRILPKYELKEGLREKNKTIVVVPALLSSPKRVQELIERLEVYYLANQENNLYFAVLGDFADASRKTLPEDRKIVETGEELIQALNRRYALPAEPIFYFFYRTREWNGAEERWMGWERKRGKLEEFNRLLRGARDTSYVAEEIPPALQQVKYVITLDADTGLPRDAARRLVGAISHPLNRAVIDKKIGRVKRGYGVLQPRIGIAATSASCTFFTRVFAGESGVDPYTTAVSDVYQDLFGEGIYTGKGIYDVDVFNEVLGERLPDNAVLSHDLLEGSYVRAGLVSDIELVDGYPARYDAYALRLHRWVRGDWQLLPWLLPTVRRANGEREDNPLTALSRWKILDNLRRSLVAPSLLLFIVSALTVFPGNPLFWLGFALLVLAFPFASHLIPGLLGQPRGKRFFGHVWTVVYDSRKLLWQALLTLAFLPYQAYLMTDAIVRTLGRLFLTRRHLLQWVTAADVEERLGHGWQAFLTRMWPGGAITLGVVGLLPVFRVQDWFWGLPFVALWAASPWIATAISQPVVKQRYDLSAGDKQQLRLVARKIWRYFEDFINTENHWIPPDNYQEDPKDAIAHRTSPTNIGLYLLSVLAARDLGYLGVLGMLERLELTLETVGKLKRWHGHLYNWYDTLTLTPLRPAFISTVDSGNLVGYLMTLRQGLLEVLNKPVVDLSRLSAGLADTFYLLREQVSGRAWQEQRQERDMASPEVRAKEGLLDIAGEASYSQVQAMRALLVLEHLEKKLQHFRAEQAGDRLRGNRTNRPDFWAAKLKEMVSSYKREMELLFPWVFLLRKVPVELEVQGFNADSEVARRWQGILQSLKGNPSFRELPSIYTKVAAEVKELQALVEAAWEEGREKSAVQDWLARLQEELEKAARAAAEWTDRCHRLVELAWQFAMETDFKVLYDEKRQMFSIGYNLEEDRLTRSYYDLLASEARQASFVAIAKGDVPQKHWFQLGRTLTRVGDTRVLVSWSGTMFEYLMPLLIMRRYDNTLLDEMYTTAVREQIRYGWRHRVPWGMSECAFSALNFQLNYQYQAFGVPTLGLQRGLERDLVVAPYATFLAVMVEPVAAWRNLQSLADSGLSGPYGMYEAIDYTRERLPRGMKGAIVKMFMAHHLGMSLVALDNYFHDNVMQRRFHSDPLVQATELLLQERMPRHMVTIEPTREETSLLQRRRQKGPVVTRRFGLPDLDLVDVFLASNGAYSLMISTAGGGYSRWEDVAISRWREDRTRDNWGMFFYIKDVQDGTVWSATYQPTLAMPDDYEVEFAEDRAEFVRRDGDVRTKTEITVSSEHNAEVRRVSLTNCGDKPRVIEVTSFFEVVLDSPAADAVHPAFGSLFVQTEFIPDCNSLLAYRRPRSEEEKRLWLVHTLAVHGNTVGRVEYETDRNRFIGRDRTPVLPAAVAESGRLSGRVGAVLDPAMSLRQRVRIPPGKTVSLIFTTAVAHSREEAVNLAHIFSDLGVANRAFSLAWTRSQVELRYLNLGLNEANLFQTMAGRLIYSYPLALQKRAEAIAQNQVGQPGLWALGISGDLPILVVKIRAPKEEILVKQALVAHEYWRMKGLRVDLVILNEESGGYQQEIQELLHRLVTTGHAQAKENQPGGVFLKQASLLSDTEKLLLEAAARVVVGGDAGSLIEQARMRPRRLEVVGRQRLRCQARSGIGAGSIRVIDGKNRQPKVPVPKIEESKPSWMEGKDLEFFNGLGGFDVGGREYVTILQDKQRTPAPWINVVANPVSGFLVSASGAGYTWAGNSRENKLTPWSNDPVVDPPGEVVYLRDVDTGEIWSPTAAPIRETEPYIARHGQGYSRFEHDSHGIYQELWQFVPLRDPVKISWLKLKNNSDRQRHLAVAYYAELTLGVLRQATQQHIVTGFDEQSRALLARNAFRDEAFPHRVAFVATSAVDFTFTGDRAEFLGKNTTLVAPHGLEQEGLSGRVGAGYDPCAALVTAVNLEPGQEVELIFLLGEADDIPQVRDLVGKYKNREIVAASLHEMRSFWDETLGTLQISTPNRALDLMVNRWLIYQTLSCRVWGRSAFYQSGGAYGFRDQLQDVMALCLSRPEIAREHILRAAAHQFVEGDVQHWWHPGRQSLTGEAEDAPDTAADKGIRTRFSDDLLWLPYVTAGYIEVTGDTGILEEVVAFIETEPLQPGEQERYDTPRRSRESASLYEHCLRAIDRSLRFGEHGLPLMGSGDWNDGMNRVGWRGSGESVWLGWFLYTVLTRFAEIGKTRGDEELASRYLSQAHRLKEALHRQAWDGEWYRRAYFDDGTPLGSAQNEECKIDSLAQSWAVISGAGDPVRAAEAMRAVRDYLVRKEDGMILLLTPPFDRSEPNPGYIRGYVPGVRENGGQYTHAAMWVIMATAMLGDGQRAMELMDLVNPINHARNRDAVELYRVEPYVVAADISAVPPNTGRGGWTWYTGAAGWMYQVAVEWLLGFKLRGDYFTLDPCIPPSWEEFGLKYRYGSTEYEIKVVNPEHISTGVVTVLLDGSVQEDARIPRRDDGQVHKVTVVIGNVPQPEMERKGRRDKVIVVK